MRELKIGAEIEFYGVNYLDVVCELQVNGINAQFMGYTHTVTDCWKLVTDGSVNSAGTGLHAGLELVSPVLHGDEGLDELCKVMQILNNLGAKVNVSTGLHVHHDVSDYTVNNFISLHNMYYRYQEAIDSILPKSRRSTARNNYCSPYAKQKLLKIQSATSIQQVADRLVSRYHVLNAQSYIKYGTIEFRQHSGTVDATKAEAWIVLTSCMVDYCKNNFVPLGGTPSSNIEDLLKLLNLDGSYFGKYLLDRKDLLAC